MNSYSITDPNPQQALKRILHNGKPLKDFLSPRQLRKATRHPVVIKVQDIGKAEVQLIG